MTETKTTEIAQQIQQLGLNHAAEILAEWIATLNENQDYQDGAEDALLTLIQAGATDPR